MTDPTAQQAARARAQRRKRLQQRQTVIFGSIIAVLLGVTLFAGAIWAEIIPSPVNIEVKTPEAEHAPLATQPCPPEGALPVPFEEITANVFNSTKTSGLGARSAEAFERFGVQVETVDNAKDLYLGSAKILVGVEYLEYGYTIADLIADSQIVVDDRSEVMVDVVIGSGFTEVRTEDELRLHPDEEIPSPPGCLEVERMDDAPDTDEDPDTDDTDGED